MSLKTNLEMLAKYNQWMNNSIYTKAEKLGEVALQENSGAFFGSILGTLNHILVADTIWLKRFASHSTYYKALDYVRNLEHPQALNQILYANLTELKVAREKMDNCIIEFLTELSDSDLDQVLEYTNTKGEPFKRVLGLLLQHFFNHQTHHRGQVTTLLTQKGIDVGVTDFFVLIPSS